MPAGASAGWRFIAPSGTSLTSLSYSRWFTKRDDNNWVPTLSADETALETCSFAYPATDCAVGTEGGERTTIALPDAASLTVGVACAPNANGYCLRGATLHQVTAVLYGATVTLSDPSTPTISNPGGSLFTTEYAKGSQAATFDASDNAGIRSARLYVDSLAQPVTAYPCDFTYPVPCSTQSGATQQLDTTKLSDGAHEVQIAATDAAGNEAKTAATTIVVDNTAPAAPQSLAVAGGAAWSSDNSFSIEWVNPSQQTAPIAAVRYAICAPGGATCGPAQRVARADIERLDGLAVPSEGEWEVRAWLEDGAGNADPTLASVVALRFGTPPPGGSGSSSSATTPEPEPPPSPEATNAPLIAAGPTSTTSVLVRTARAPARLRITSARRTGYALVLRGRTAAQARGRATLTVRRPGGRVIRRTFTLPGGRFRLALHDRGLEGAPRATLRYLGTTAFTPARVTARIHG